MPGFNVGDIWARVGARFEGRGFDEFDRRFAGTERKARDPVKAKLEGDFDSGSFEKFDRALDRARAHRDVTTELKVDADTSDVDRYIRKLLEAKAAGDDTNRSFGGMKATLGGIGWGAAAAGVGPLTAGLLALAGAATEVVGGLSPLLGLAATIPQGLGAGLQAFGVFKLATSGVTDALKAYEQQEKSSAQGAQTAARARSAAAGAIASAERSRTDAARGVNDAERQLGDANRNATIAEQNLTKARKDASAQLEDLKFQAQDTANAEARSALTLEQARQHLRQVREDPTATALDVADAQQTLDEAKQARTEAVAHAGRAHQAYQQARQGGIEQMPDVVQARREYANAEESVQKAAEGVTTAQEQERAATQELTRARQQAAQAGDAQSGAANRYQSILKELAPAQRRFVEMLIAQKDKGEELKRAAASGFFPGATKGFDAALKLFPEVKTAISDTAGVLGHLADQAGRYLGSRAFGRDFQSFTAENAKLIGRAGDAGLHLFDAIVQVTQAAQPLTDWLSRMGDAASHSVDDWAKAERKSGNLRDFFAETKHVLKDVIGILGDLGGTAVDVIKVAMPYGIDLLDNLKGAAGELHDLVSSAQGQNALKAFFHDAQAPLGELWGTLKELVGGIGSLINHQSLGELASIIRIIRVDVVPTLVTAAQVLTREVLPHLIPLVADAARLLRDASPALKPLGVVLGALLAVLDAVVKVTDWATQNLPGILKLLPGLLLAGASYAGWKGLVGWISRAGDALKAMVGLETVAGGGVGGAGRAAERGIAIRGAEGAAGGTIVGTLTGGVLGGGTAEELQRGLGEAAGGKALEGAARGAAHVRANTIDRLVRRLPIFGATGQIDFAPIMDVVVGSLVAALGVHLIQSLAHPRKGGALAGTQLSLPSRPGYIGRLADEYIPGTSDTEPGVQSDIQRLGGTLPRAQMAARQQDARTLQRLAYQARSRLFEARQPESGISEKDIGQLEKYKNALVTAARAADQFRLNQIKAFRDTTKYHSEGGLFAEFDKQAQHMTARGRLAGADAMIEMSRSLEREGKLPRGATEKLIKQIEHRYQGLKPFLAETGHDSMRALEIAMRDRRVVNAVQDQVDTIGKTWDDAPKLARTTAFNARANWQREMDFLREKIKTSTGQQRDDAIAAWKKLKGYGDDASRATHDAWTRRMKDLADKTRDEMRRAAKEMKDNAHDGSTKAVHSFDNFRDKVQAAMRDGTISVGKGLGMIDKALREMASALGIHLGSTLKVTAIPQNIGAITQGILGAPGKARGGFIGEPGDVGPDEVPLSLPPTWAIFNRWHQGILARGAAALGMARGGNVGVVAARGEYAAAPEELGWFDMLAKAAGYMGVTDMFRRERRPHYARGGYVFPFPKGAHVSWARIDQGQDLQGPPGSPIVAIAPGVISSAHDRFGGFGDDYPTERITAGPLRGRSVYYGHAHATRTGNVKAGDVIGVTQTRANTWTAAPAGWLELGFLPYGSMSAGRAIAPLLHALAGNRSIADAMGLASIPTPKLRGPDSALKRVAQAALTRGARVANNYLSRNAPAGGTVNVPSSGPAALGPTHWAGKVSTFGPPGEAAGTTASGASSAAPGIALRSKSTLGRMFEVMIGRHRGKLRQTDWGPAAWTGRVLDVTGAGARAIGIDPSHFPTGAYGTADLVGRRFGGWARAASGRSPQVHSPETRDGIPRIDLPAKIKKWSPAIDKFTNQLTRMDHDYQETERTLARDDQDLEYVVTDPATGIATVNQKAIDQRVGHLNTLIGLKRDAEKVYEKLLTAIRSLISAYRRASTILHGELSRSKGTRRAGIETTLQDYSGRITDLQGTLQQESFSLDDLRQDVLDLMHERDTLGPSSAAQAAASQGTGTTADQQALLDQANARAAALLAGNQAQEAALKTFRGPGDIGTGTAPNAFQAAAGDVYGAGVGNTSPARVASQAAAAAPAPLPGWYLLKIDDPEGQKRIAAASNGGNNLAGYVPAAREVTGL